MKKSNFFRTGLILALLVLAVVYLFPTIRTGQLDRVLTNRLATISEKTGISQTSLREDIFRFSVDLADQIRNMENVSDADKDEIAEEIEYLRGDFFDSFDEAQSKAIRRGLDLQGGMYLVLEVNLVELMDNLAKNRDAAYEEIITEVREKLSGDTDSDFETTIREAFESRDIPMAMYFGRANQSNKAILNELAEKAEEAVELTMTKLSNRVDEFGVSEPSITKHGTRRIIVELPGIQDPDRARNLIGRTALLEFKFVAEPKITADVAASLDAYLAEEIKENKGEATEKAAEAETAEADSAAAELEGMFADSGEETELDENRPFTSLGTPYAQQILVEDVNKDAISRILGRQDVQDIIPPEYKFLWSKGRENFQDGSEFWSLYLVQDRAELTGAMLSDAYVNIGTGGQDPSQAGEPIVHLTFNREGGRKFARVTENNVGRHLAIILDNKIHMAPRIQDRIAGGQAIIEGSSDVEEAKDISIVLRAGALPAPVDIIEERTVGPSLGSDSIKAGTVSALIGMALVMIFMVIYYRGSGLIADLVLVLNLIFLMSVLGGFGLTLTLPGIAGIILTIGMAVDANVLIFERIREEVKRGNTPWNAVQAGFGRAFVTIMDANITTIIAGLVLYQFGTGPIRGFALTLMIGIISSMFTSLVISRAIFDWMTSRGKLKQLSI